MATIGIMFANSANAQTLTNTTFLADSSGNEEINGTYFVKPNADTTAYTIKTSIQITSSPRNYTAADKKASNGLAHTKMTTELFKIAGIEKVELGTYIVKVYLADDTEWEDVSTDVINTIRGYAYWSVKKRLDDGQANH